MTEDKNLIIEEMTLNLEEAYKKIERLENLNSNLLRIMRERSNASRGIHPKKSDGYIVVGSHQIIERYQLEIPEDGYENYDYEWLRNNNRMQIVQKSVITWKTAVQTPYDIASPISALTDQIKKDMKEKGILNDIKCDDIINTLAEAISDNKNHIYRIGYRANCFVGVWEAELYTTESIVIPDNRRPRQKRK